MSFSKLCVTLGCLSCLALAGMASADDRPNVLIILSDDQGWGDVGFNGGTDIPTPNLDRLASNGVSFEQGYASHPYCSPSRAGLLTGRHQQRFGHENNTPHGDTTSGLPLDELMISEVLQAGGYRTCAIGKWHLGDDEKFWPNQRGFDDWYGFYGGGMGYWGSTGKKPKMSGVLRDGNLVPQSELTYLTDDFSREAVNYIETYHQEEAPFFMYLAYNAPHAPIQATEEYLKMVEHIEYGDRAAYAAMVAGMDVGIGNVIDALKKTGEFENTLIFFYSDNGGHLHGANNQPYRGHKGMLFEGGIRVPFLVSWPQGIEGTYRYQESITALDVFPTIIAATGVENTKEEPLDGVNLLPYLNGEIQGAPHDRMFWRYSDGAGYVVRDGDLKLIKSEYKQDYLLFDLSKDRFEHTNLAEQMPEKLQEMQRLYEEWSSGLIPAKWQDAHIEHVHKEEAKRGEYLRRASAGQKKVK